MIQSNNLFVEIVAVLTFTIYQFKLRQFYRILRLDIMMSNLLYKLNIFVGLGSVSLNSLTCGTCVKITRFTTLRMELKCIIDTETNH